MDEPRTTETSRPTAPELLAGIVRDLAGVLSNADAASELPPAREGEAPFSDLEFFYQPQVPAFAQKKDAKEAVARVSGETPTANAACALCAERMYPVRRFRRHGSIPILVLYYAGAAGGAKIRPDRSDRFVLGTKEEDELFSRLLTAGGIDFNTPYFQEFPACHFNPDRSSADDWQRRARNCLVHVAATVSADSIRLIIASGHAAVCLLGEKEASEAAKSGAITELALSGESTVPCLVIRSPAALLAMEKRRKNAADADKPEFSRQEIEVKERLLASLVSARKILGI